LPRIEYQANIGVWQTSAPPAPPRAFTLQQRRLASLSVFFLLLIRVLRASTAARMQHPPAHCASLALSAAALAGGR